MKHNKITIAVQATTAAMILGVAGQAAAFELNAGDVEAELYGYARLNASYDIDENIAISTRAGSFRQVNTGDDEDDEITGHFGADAFQSRIGVNMTHSSGVNVKIEGDFRGGGGGELRLRHAYGEYKGVMMGQNWSNFTSFVGYTPTLDFDALPGNPGAQFRAAQLRYTMGPLSISAEEPLSYNGLIEIGPVDPDRGVRTMQESDDEKESLPLLTARLEDSAGALSYSVAALLRQVEYDTGSQDDSAVGYGAFAALSFALTDNLSLQGAINYVKGAGVYLYRSGENFAAVDGYVKNNGDLELIGGFGGTIGMTAGVGPGSVNVGYGFTEVDWDDAEDDLGSAAVADRHENNSAVMANYQWNPAEAVTVGVEYAYYLVDEVGGADGDASRILFAGQYNF
jgi:hypothetical protein